MTHVCRDASNATHSTEALLVLVRNQKAKHCVYIEGRLMLREAMDAEPKTRNPVSGVEVNFIDHKLRIVGSLIVCHKDGLESNVRIGYTENEEGYLDVNSPYIVCFFRINHVTVFRTGRLIL